jgi:hypothetical protein
MAGWLERDPTVGAVGMRLVEPNGAAIRPTMRSSSAPEGLRQVTYHPAEVADEYSDIGAAYELPADRPRSSAAADFQAVGGFDRAISTAWDVDLCLRLAERLAGASSAIPRSPRSTIAATPGPPASSRASPIDLSNPVADRQPSDFNAHFKRRIVQRTLLSLIGAVPPGRACCVTFIVTDASFDAGRRLHRDGNGLGHAHAVRLGNAVRPVRPAQRHRCRRRDAPRHDLGKARSANPGLVTVAWIRNRVDEWLARRISNRDREC